MSKMDENARGFDWKDVTEDSWEEFLPKVVPYLRLDIISLREVWNRFLDAQHELVEGIDVRRCVSGPSLAWKHVLARVTVSGEISGFL